MKKIVDVGVNVAKGIWEGITKTGDWLLDKIKSFAHTITQGIKDFFGIKSPSRVMRDEVGKMIVAGVGVGISDNERLAISSMENVCVKLEKVSEDAAKNAEELEKKRRSRELKNLKNSLDLNLITEQDYYERLKQYRDKYFAQGTDDWYSYTEEIAKYNKKLSDNAVEEQKKAVEKITELRRELADKLRDNSGSLLKTTKITIKGTGKDGSDENYTNYSLNDLSAENDKLERYRRAILELKALGGVSAGIFAQLADMSVEEGTNLAETILRADEKARDEFLRSYRENDSLADEIAAELNPVLNQSKFEEIGADAAQSFDDGYRQHLEEEREVFLKTLENHYGTLPDYYYTLGTDAANEFDRGFFARVPEMMEKFRQCFIAEVNTFADRISSVVTNRIQTAAASGSVTNNTFTFNSSRDTTTQQLRAAKHAAALKRLRGGE